MERGLPQPITYDYDETTGNIILPEGPPFDGESYLIRLSEGWVEAWWDRGRSYNTEYGCESEGFEWVCLDGKFTSELNDALYWMSLSELLNTPSDQSEETP